MTLMMQKNVLVCMSHHSPTRLLLRGDAILDYCLRKCFFLLTGYIKDNLKKSASVQFIDSKGSKKTYNATQVNAISNIRDYVEADAAMLVLFDLENPELATRQHWNDWSCRSW